jgi:hypothetical protein
VEDAEPHVQTGEGSSRDPARAGGGGDVRLEPVAVGHDCHQRRASHVGSDTSLLELVRSECLARRDRDARLPAERTATTTRASGNEPRLAATIASAAATAATSVVAAARASPMRPSRTSAAPGLSDEPAHLLAVLGVEEVHPGGADDDSGYNARGRALGLRPLGKTEFVGDHRPIDDENRSGQPRPVA